MKGMEFKLWNHDFGEHGAWEDDFYILPNGEVKVFSYPEGEYLTPRFKHTLIKSTGLPDKNGKEIWEGDIARFEGGLLSEIRFEKGAFCLLNKGFTKGGRSESWQPVCLYRLLEAEVLGNIYENGDLLK